MTKRVLFLLLLPAAILPVSCSNKSSSPTTPKQTAVRERRLEGYPAHLMKARNDYSTKIRSGRRSVVGFESVISVSRTWSPGAVITVAFQGGSPELRNRIAQAVLPWMQAGNVKFDFKSGAGFRDWTASDSAYAADVRIAFLGGEDGGYWSLVGRDGVNPSIVQPNQPSMNFEGFTDSLPTDWQAIVLHEFGHALGFEHEHQSPKADCEKEFRWDDDPGYVLTADSYGQRIPDGSGRRPGIYTRLEGPLNNWTKEQIDFNLRQFAFQADLLATSFDKQSIMLYHFDPWMYVDVQTSQCYTPTENAVLSEGDIDAARRQYPHNPVEARAKATRLRDAFRQMLDNPTLAPDIRSLYTKELRTVGHVE